MPQKEAADLWSGILSAHNTFIITCNYSSLTVTAVSVYITSCALLISASYSEAYAVLLWSSCLNIEQLVVSLRLVDGMTGRIYS